MQKKFNTGLVLFDLDGTLIDTAPDFHQSINNILVKYEYPEVDIETLRPYVSEGSSELIKFAFKIDQDNQMLSQLKDEFLEVYKENFKLIEKAISYEDFVKLASEKLKKSLSGAELFLKLECMQHTGTFKARGAISVALQIPNDKVGYGVTAASAGNHAIAASWAAKQMSTNAKVVMASTANPYRIELAKRYGGEVILKEPGKALFDEAERLVKEEDRTFIHPFEGINTTLGASGVGLELMDDIKDLDAVVVSVGGGGLMSGVSAAVKAINPECKVYGVEPVGADSMSKSITFGAPITLSSIDTIADSLSPPKALPFGFQLCKKNIEKIV